MVDSRTCRWRFYEIRIQCSCCLSWLVISWAKQTLRNSWIGIHSTLYWPVASLVQMCKTLRPRDITTLSGNLQNFDFLISWNIKCQILMGSLHPQDGWKPQNFSNIIDTVPSKSPSWICSMFGSLAVVISKEVTATLYHYYL